MTLDRTARRPGPMALAVVLTLAAILRLIGLSSFAWEQDELYTLNDSRSLLGAAAGPGIAARPVYYVLQRALFEVFPPTELWMRLPAFVFGMLGVWLTWVVADRVFGRYAALVSSALVAMSSWHIYSSQYARYWTLLYLLSLLLVWIYPTALDLDRGGRYRAAGVVAALGALTHPTFVFAAAGYLPAAHTVDADGTPRWRWPNARAWINLWIPLILGVPLVVFVLTNVVQGTVGPDNGGEGLGRGIRAVLGMVEWATPPVVVAALLSALYLLLQPARPGDRRFGVMAIAGCFATAFMMLVASVGADLYAAYGMAGLPLIFLAIGGAAQRLVERVGSPAPAVGALAVLLAALAPGTVSNLRDGTRHEFRPAYRYVAENDPGALVVTWPIVIQRAYAPALNAQEMVLDHRVLDALLVRHGRLWIIAPYSREGLIGDNGYVSAWMNAYCRRVLQTSRGRFDYRVLRVEAWRCDSP